MATLILDPEQLEVLSNILGLEQMDNEKENAAGINGIIGDILEQIEPEMKKAENLELAGEFHRMFYELLELKNRLVNEAETDLLGGISMDLEELEEIVKNRVIK